MSSTTNSNTNTNTIDLRALLESDAPSDHIPKAFKQMHSIIKKLQKENKKLKEQNKKLKEENDCKQLISYIESQNKEIEKLKEENKKTDYKLTNGIVIQATKGEIKIIERYEKKLDVVFMESKNHLDYEKIHSYLEKKTDFNEFFCNNGEDVTFIDYIEHLEEVKEDYINDIEELTKKNEELQSNLDEMNYQYKCLRDGEAGY